MSKRQQKKLSPSVKMEIITICKEYKERKHSVQFLLDILNEADRKKLYLYTNTALKQVLAVDHALANLEIPLKKPIWENITRRTPYEMLIVPIGRQGFYRLRGAFIQDIAKMLGYV